MQRKNEAERPVVASANGASAAGITFTFAVNVFVASFNALLGRFRR